MKLVPYYRRTITNLLTDDIVLSKFENLIKEHRTNNFPDKEGFIGGEIETRQFKIFRTGKGIRKVFPVYATGHTDGNGNWTLTFTSNKLSLIIFFVTFSAMTFVTIRYATLFFIPLMIFYYVAGQISFNKDSRTLEKLILDELETI